MRDLDRLEPLALLVMRLTLGTIMSVHGYHKSLWRPRALRPHVERYGASRMAGLPFRIHGADGGLLLWAGFFTRPAAFAICLNSCVAIWKVHLHNGLMGSPDRPGFEFPLAAATLAFALIFFGAGPISIDHVLRGGGSSR